MFVSFFFFLLNLNLANSVYDVCQRQRVSLQLNSNSWSVALDSYAKKLQLFFGKAGIANASLAVECIETVRHFCAPRA